MSNLEAPFEGDNKASQLQQEKQESILDYGTSSFQPVDYTHGVNEAGEPQQEKQEELILEYDKNPSTTVDHTEDVHKMGQWYQEKQDESIFDYDQPTLPCPISNFEDLDKNPSTTIAHTEGITEVGQPQLDMQDGSNLHYGQYTFLRLISYLESLGNDPSLNVDYAEGIKDTGQQEQEKQDEPIFDFGNDPSPNNDYAEGINDTSQPEQEKQDEPIFDFGVEEDVRVDDSEKSKPVSEVVLKESESEITSKNESFLAKSPVFSFSIQVCSLACHELPVQIPRMGRKMSLNRKVVLLRDPAMKVWPVLYVEKSKSAQFLSGWEAFLAGNGLREGDTCHFQLAAAAPEHLFQVMISQGR